MKEEDPKPEKAKERVSQFLTGALEKNREFAEKDLARSGLTIEDIRAQTPAMLQLIEGATAGYVIPYYNLEGKPLVDAHGRSIAFRTRFQAPEFSKVKRYIQASEEQMARHGLPAFLPYIHPLTLSMKGDELVCAEGEKKTAAIIKHLEIPAFGIGGCSLWGNPDRSGGVHPWITGIIRKRGVSRLTIVPDGDVTRYDICRAYGSFARALEADGITVRILKPPGKIDDLLVEWPEADRRRNWLSLPALSTSDLVQTPNSLITRYGLAFRSDSKDRAIVHQHTANVMRLMEEHNAFPKVWRNLDNNRVMVGEEAATPDLTEMEIANFFQHNLGFDKVNHRLVYSCIQALAKKNARSPYLEYIRALCWDGTPRLDHWLTEYWGVDDTEYIREVAAKWLISACARLDKPGTKLDWMLIIVGPQGTGKTSMPGILFKDSALTMYGEHNDKDLHMLLHSALCVGFDELDSFGKRESSNLKAMITRNEDAFRPPYGASVEIFPRRFTLYGCGNRYEFLQHDPSGYRRYAVVEVGRLLDFAGLAAARDQLWAEAWARYRKGTDFWEVKGAGVQAQRYVVANPIEDQILAFIARERSNKSSPSCKDGHLYVTMTHLLHALGLEGQVRNSGVTRDIAAILRGLGAYQSVCAGPAGGIKQRYYIVPLQSQ